MINFLKTSVIFVDDRLHTANRYVVFQGFAPLQEKKPVCARLLKKKNCWWKLGNVIFIVVIHLLHALLVGNFRCKWTYKRRVSNGKLGGERGVSSINEQGLSIDFIKMDTQRS